MDGVTLYTLILAAIFLPIMAFVWFMARRQRLQEEAEEAERASGTAAE